MNGANLSDILLPEDRRKKDPSFKLTFGEILILLSVIFGLLFQYVNFSVKMGEFEGYTRGKIDSIESELRRINQSVEGHINREQR